MGINAKQLLDVRGRGGVVLVVGAQEQRDEIALAGLVGGYVSVLITDNEFAQRLVSRYDDRVKDGTLQPPREAR
jgi:DNA-binding transcriptional regulator LsrR (DeoR family)